MQVAIQTTRYYATLSNQYLIGLYHHKFLYIKICVQRVVSEDFSHVIEKSFLLIVPHFRFSVINYHLTTTISY